MGGTAIDLTDAIRQDLTCPQCEYSLRGLAGDIIRCPECGTECDIPRMVANRWNRPWMEAPEYSRLLHAVAWMAIASMILLLIFVYETEGFRGSGVVTFCCGSLAFIGWVMILLRSGRAFDDCLGILLSLLAHLLLAGYIAGTIGFIWAVVLCFQKLTLPAFMMSAVIMLVCVGGLVLCRYGERQIAQQCIRQHLRRLNEGELSIP